MKTTESNFNDVRLAEADAVAAGRGDLTSQLAAIKADLDKLAALANELRGWAIALATKLNADTGVADTDYDTTIAAETVTVTAK